jgi:hypothetical protein
MVLKFSSFVLNVEFHFRRDTVPLLTLSKYLFTNQHIIHQSVSFLGVPRISVEWH